jgi:hypothetical protein
MKFIGQKTHLNPNLSNPRKEQPKKNFMYNAGINQAHTWGEKWKVKRGRRKKREKKRRKKQWYQMLSLIQNHVQSCPVQSSPVQTGLIQSNPTKEWGSRNNERKRKEKNFQKQCVKKVVSTHSTPDPVGPIQLWNQRETEYNTEHAVTYRRMRISTIYVHAQFTLIHHGKYSAQVSVHSATNSAGDYRGAQKRPSQ